MCRLISISGKIGDSFKVGILKKFQRLAENGEIPQGTEGGHKDGWGIIAYKKRQMILSAKKDTSALDDPLFLKTIKELGEKKTDAIIGHLRKASVGARSVKNTHPFIHGTYSFCQNGKIVNSEKISIKSKFRKLISGETDSERFFIYILQLLDGYEGSSAETIRGAIISAVNYVRKNFDFTALNMIFSDGNYIWALREINENNEKVKQLGLMNYYSLNMSVGKAYQIIVSEKIDISGTKWKEMRNHELVEFDFAGRRLKRSMV